MSKEAKEYVDALIAAGSNIQAIDRIGYVMVEPVDIHDDEAWLMIDWVAQQFENVDALKAEIIDYLHELGRVERGVPDDELEELRDKLGLTRR